jgi:hypothetical protein
MPQKAMRSAMENAPLAVAIEVRIDDGRDSLHLRFTVRANRRSEPCNTQLNFDLPQSSNFPICPSGDWSRADIKSRLFEQAKAAQQDVG